MGLNDGTREEVWLYFLICSKKIMITAGIRNTGLFQVFSALLKARLEKNIFQVVKREQQKDDASKCDTTDTTYKVSY